MHKTNIVGRCTHQIYVYLLDAIDSLPFLLPYSKVISLYYDDYYYCMQAHGNAHYFSSIMIYLAVRWIDYGAKNTSELAHVSVIWWQSIHVQAL